MKFPEWTPELEAELRTAYQTAPAQPASGGSRHVGLKAVYDLLKTRAQEQDEARRELERRELEQREQYIRNYNASMSNGPWDDRMSRSDRIPDVGIPIDPFA